MRTLVNTLLLLILTFGACQAPGRKEEFASNPALEGTWLNSKEESRGDTLVYRPNTYRFSPIRGRTGFAIRSFGRFVQYDIAPGDGLESRNGTWTAPNSSLMHIHLNGGPASDYNLELLAVKKKVLKVRRLP